jgi:hypothetical protein
LRFRFGADFAADFSIACVLARFAFFAVSLTAIPFGSGTQL